MAKAVMFLGTGSDVGKSVSATAFCRILKRRGVDVTPFKAQNMSNNSCVTPEGGEIGRAQAVQAEAAGLLPSVHMNPVLIKPSGETGSQVILQGRVHGQMAAAQYPGVKGELKRAVMESYRVLEARHDAIVMEGAGSCCEMNLKANDLVNFTMARAAGAACVLVADIDRGGVFAQIIGTWGLMSRSEKAMTTGFLINKFRGDPRLFDAGIHYIERRTGRPVLGLVPFYHDITIDSEDSVAVQEDRRAVRPTGARTVNVGVLKLPAISNFTDIEALEAEADVTVNYLRRPADLTAAYDCLILPGTKNTMEDGAWLHRAGWFGAVRRFAGEGRPVLGICGGFQLMGTTIRDPHGVESDRKEMRGLGILPVETTLEKEKVVRRVTGRCPLTGTSVSGYEIHMGRSRPLTRAGGPMARLHEPGGRRSWDDGWTVNGGDIAGTYVHGILDGPGFRGAFLNRLRRAKGLRERRPGPGRRARFRQYDRLADHFERHCDVDKILDKMFVT